VAGGAVKKPDQILALNTGILLLSDCMKYCLPCVRNKEWQSNSFVVFLCVATEAALKLSVDCFFRIA